jgi:hypothetical protein
MRRDRSIKLGRWLSLLAAGVLGYLIGDWHSIAVRTAELSATQNIALRFPEAKADAAETTGDVSAGGSGSLVPSDGQGALLSPERMAPQRAVLQSDQQAPQARIQLASADPTAPLPAPDAGQTHRVAAAVAAVKADVAAVKAEVKSAIAHAKADLKPATAGGDVRRANRQGFVLNDAQIASIKTRLHLSPGQEQMWPAVEAALRNIAYVKARDARKRGGAGASDLASLDPDGAEVQNLKSAAVPLIMSFNEEQRSEVRNLAHVMGLDQLAAQF